MGEVIHCHQDIRGPAVTFQRGSAMLIEILSKGFSTMYCCFVVHHWQPSYILTYYIRMKEKSQKNLRLTFLRCPSLQNVLLPCHQNAIISLPLSCFLGSPIVSSIWPRFHDFVTCSCPVVIVSYEVFHFSSDLPWSSLWYGLKWMAVTKGLGKVYVSDSRTFCLASISQYHQRADRFITLQKCRQWLQDNPVELIGLHRLYILGDLLCIISVFFLRFS